MEGGDGGQPVGEGGESRPGDDGVLQGALAAVAACKSLKF